MNNNEKYSFSLDIKLIKEKLLLNQEDLAYILSTSQSTIARIESGVKPTQLVEKKIRILKLSIDNDELYLINKILNYDQYGRDKLNIILNIGTLSSNFDIEDNKKHYEKRINKITKINSENDNGILDNVGKATAVGLIPAVSLLPVVGMFALPLAIASITKSALKLNDKINNESNNNKNENKEHLDILIRDVIKSELETLKVDDQLKEEIIKGIIESCDHKFYDNMNNSGTTDFKKQSWAHKELSEKIKITINFILTNCITIKSILYSEKMKQIYKFLTNILKEEAK